LSKLHHAAFDCGFFTLDEEYHIRVNPAFETESAVLEQTIVKQAGRQVSLPEDAVAREYLHEHNASFEWV